MRKLKAQDVTSKIAGAGELLEKGKTYDCALDLLPEALPPDFPPVIFAVGFVGRFWLKS